jgi:hypothetical protein
MTMRLDPVLWCHVLSPCSRLRDSGASWPWSVPNKGP